MNLAQVGPGALTIDYIIRIITRFIVIKVSGCGIIIEVFLLQVIYAQLSVYRNKLQDRSNLKNGVFIYNDAIFT